MNPQQPIATAHNVADYYGTLLSVHGVTGLVAKVCLLCALILVANGNRKPGFQLLAWVFAAQFASAAYLSLGESGATAVTIGCLVGALSAAFAAVKFEGEWSVLPAAGWKRWAVLGAYLWAFWYPVWSLHPGVGGAVRSLFLSPMSAIPGPTIVAGLALAFASWPNTPRLFGWGTATAGVVVGGAEVLAGAWSGALLAGGAIGLAVLMIRRGVEAGVLEDDRPPAEEAARERELKRLKQVFDQDKPPDGGGGRTWNIK